MTEDDLPRVLKLKDVAELLRVSLKQARALPIPRIEGLGPRTTRYKREDVLAFIEKKRRSEEE